VTLYLVAASTSTPSVWLCISEYMKCLLCEFVYDNRVSPDPEPPRRCAHHAHALFLRRGLAPARVRAAREDERDQHECPLYDDHGQSEDVQVILAVMVVIRHVRDPNRANNHPSERRKSEYGVEKVGNAVAYAYIANGARVSKSPIRASENDRRWLK
jgi:hypothetical protein